MAPLPLLYMHLQGTSTRDAMNTSFHQRSLGLLRGGAVPRYTTELDACVQRLNALFPEALWEAYAIGGHYLQDPRWFEIAEGSSGRFLVFLNEEQGVFYWGVVLDGSPDPPVFTRLRNVPQAEWIFSCEKLSTFIYTVLFDSQHWDHHCSINDGREAFGKVIVSEIFDPLTPDDLSFLRGSFREEPRTFGLPAPVTYRFSDGWEKRITIDNYDGPCSLNGDRWHHQSDWAVSAAGEADFVALKRKLHPLWPLPDA